MDQGKVQIQRFIEDTKQEEETQEADADDTKTFCPNCRAEVGKVEKFCRSCGHTLQV